MTSLAFLTFAAFLVSAALCQTTEEIIEGDENFGCSNPISSWTARYKDEKIFSQPNSNSYILGTARYQNGEWGAVCYTIGGYWEGSNVWMKICMHGSCCQMGYVPFYQFWCESGQCSLPYCPSSVGGEEFEVPPPIAGEQGLVE